MRNPARIDILIEKLRLLWHTSPDIRLGQLIVNLSRNEFGIAQRAALFNLEDDLIEQAIDVEMGKK